jgi:nucleoside-diphosphate-sugar epimerase
MILVVGGAGYVGSHVIDILGSRAFVYDNLLYTNEYLEPAGFVRADVNDHETLKRYLKQADSVIWLAAIVGDAPCMVNPRYAMQTNEEAVKILADNYDGPIVFLSSCSVFGVSEEAATEESELAPLSLYAETKIKAEQHLRDKQALILRLGTLHGTSTRMRFDLAVNVLTRNAVVEGRMEVFGGHQYRPLVSVRDVAELICQTLDRGWTPGIYNVASENLSILDVARVVADEIPGTELAIVENSFEDHRNYRVVTEKAESQLDFRPQRMMRDSVRDIVELLSNGRIKDLGDIRYANLSALHAAA